MVKGEKKAWKLQIILRIQRCFDEYPKCFLVNVDNVGSNQMQQIRIALRGKAEILMGKNTIMRKAIKTHMENHPALERLLPHLKGNIGFVFTKEDLTDMRDMILLNRKRAPAKAGALAPLDVFVPPQNTGLGPEKTSFFQALTIPTKIARGTIEILNEVHLINKGDRVGASEAALLNMLNISPFTYGLVITQVYDSGSCFSPEVLDITEDDLRMRLMEGIRVIAAVSLQIGYPTIASAPHSIVNGFKNLLAVSVMTDYTFNEAEMTKEYLADPSKFAAAAAPVAAATEEKKEEKKVESEEEESDDDMGFGLFD